MDSIKNEILKMHFEKIIKKIGYEEVNNFLDIHLEESDRYIALEQYLQLFAEDEQRVIEPEHNYPNKFTLDSKTKIFPLSLKVDDACSSLTFGENYIKSSKIIDPQAFGGSSINNKLIPSIFSFIRTENNDILLLKCHIYPKKIVYFTLNLISLFSIDENSNTIDEKPFDRSIFMITMLPEFLTLLTDEAKRYEAYSIKNILFENGLDHIIQYNIGNRDDLYYIREGLKRKNSEHGNIIVTHPDKKKDLIIKVGDKKTIKARYLESKIQVINSKKSEKTYRTKNAITLKDDIDDVIIKAIEKENGGKCHYIYISGFKNATKNIIKDKGECKNKNKGKNKKSNSRFSISALFHKDENGNLVLQRDMEHRYPKLDYADVSEAVLKLNS